MVEQTVDMSNTSKGLRISTPPTTKSGQVCPRRAKIACELLPEEVGLGMLLGDGEALCRLGGAVV